MAVTYRCGHPRTPENSYSTGNGYTRCAMCNRQRVLENYHQKPKQKSKREKYRGIPAGRIEIPGYNWNGTRLG